MPHQENFDDPLSACHKFPPFRREWIGGSGDLIMMLAVAMAFALVTIAVAFPLLFERH
jgi:hypothetical protein